MYGKIADHETRSWAPSAALFNQRMKSNYFHFGRQRSTGGRAPRRVLKDAANGRSYEIASEPQYEEIADVVKPGNLFQLAIHLDDVELMHFLLTASEDYTLRKNVVSEGNTARFFQFQEPDLLFAIRLGRTRLLELIIKRTGAGIPLDALVKKSGVEVEVTEKPKYYQGLSVHGKKRADWANAGRDTQVENKDAQHPPLLHAARLGSLESVEWFSSDVVLRRYSEFMDSHLDDVRIQNLAKAKGGLEAAIRKWLDLRSHLLIHCVVLGKTSEDSLNMLRHLCKTHPDALHHRSSSGMTPLHLAFSLHRIEMVKILIAAGADQTTRNNVGTNIVHSIFSDDFLKLDDIPRMRELLNLIDPRLISSLFTERTTEGPGAATPLARWLHKNVKSNTGWYYHGDNKAQADREQFISLVLEFSKGADLDLVNGEGDTPLHAAVRYGADAVLRVMLACRPELLFRENASGRTPFELAQDAYLAFEVFKDPPSVDKTGEANYGIRRRQIRHRDTATLLSRKPETFVDEPEDKRSGIEKVWLVCKEVREKVERECEGGVKRKLVSLVEANEVAKRLALKKGSAENAVVSEEKRADGEEIGGDEVVVWWYMGLSADK
jgi:hypothetical protein